MKAGNKPSSQVAVILRTHLLNEKFYDLLEVLSRSAHYDLFVALDQTNGSLSVKDVRNLTHNVGTCRYFDLYTGHPNIFWHCGDYVLQFCAAEIPNYEYYMMIEYDVDLVRRSPAFIDRLVSKLGELDSPDFVSASLSPADGHWRWYEAARKRFATVYNSGVFAFVVASKRALDFLYEARKLEAVECQSPDDLVNCEAFCASALMEGGFSCAPLTSLIPGAVDFSTFHPPLPKLEDDCYLLDRYEIDDPNIEIVHPVYDGPTYLQRKYQKHKADGDLAGFAEELESFLPVNEAEERLVAHFRAVVAGKRSSRAVTTLPVPSVAPAEIKKRKVAVVTNSFSAGFYFPLWHHYYSAQFGAESLHLLTLAGMRDQFDGYELASITEMPPPFEDSLRLEATTQRVQELAKTHDYVINVDTDEFLIPDPSKFKGLADYVHSLSKEYVTARGFDVLQVPTEPEIMLDYPILAHQRHLAFSLTALHKTSITAVPMKWNRGFHCCSSRPALDSLFLFHLKRADISQQARWNQFIAAKGGDDPYLQEYYKASENEILAFHDDFSNPERRPIVEGENVMYREEFTSKFLESVRYNAYLDLYDFPYIIEGVNVSIPEKFCGML